MKLSTQENGDAIHVTVHAARIDAAIAIQFKDRFREAVQHASGRIILDLSQVTFLDSSGLGAVVAAKKFLTDTQQLELAGLTPAVEKVFRLTRMDSVFKLHPSIPADDLTRTSTSGVA